MADDIDIGIGVRGVSGAVSQLGGLSRAITGVSNAASIAVGAIALMETAFLGMIASAIKLSDATGKAADKVGASVEQFSALAKEAAVADIGIDELSESLKFFQRQMVAQGRSNEDVLQTFVATIQELSKMEDQASLTTASMVLFGRGGTKVNEFIRDSPGLLERMNRSIEEGTVVTTEAARSADVWGDNLVILKQRATFLAVEIAGKILPSMVEFSQRLLDAERESGTLSGVFEFLIKLTIAFVQGLRMLGSVVAVLFRIVEAGVTTVWKHLVNGFQAASDAAGTLVTNIKSTLTAFSSLWSAAGKATSGNFVEAIFEAELGVSALGDAVRSQAASIPNFIKSLADDTLATGKALAENVTNAFKEGAAEIEAIANQTNALFDALSPAGGGSTNLSITKTGNPLSTDFDAQAKSMEAFQNLWRTMFVERLDGAFRERVEADLVLEDRLKQIEALKPAEDEANSLRELAWAAHEKRMTDISRQESRNRLNLMSQTLAGFGSMFGSLAQLTATFGKKAFGLTQALRYAEAIVNTAAAVTNALAAPVPWPIPLVFAAAAAAAGAAQIAVISSAKPPTSGQFHAGIDSVPTEGSFLLSAGERVVQPAANKQLTEFLNSVEGGGMRAGNVYLDGESVGTVLWEMSRDGRLQLASKAVV